MKRDHFGKLLAWLCVPTVLAAGVTAQDQGTKLPKSPLVSTQTGALPIILSAPHGGTQMVPDVPERKGEGLTKGGGAGFVTVRDGNTDLLARDLSAAIEVKMGKKPYLVIARFARKYIDANRPPAIGYENKNAKPVYDVYHQTLERYCRDVQKAYGRGLLLDIHGQGQANDTIYRGTQNGKSVKLLVERFGPGAHIGPKSFFGILSQHGLKVFPLDNSKEAAGFSGGFITQTYGSNQGYGIDAIQLEFGGNYRNKDKLKDTAAKVADTVAAYAKLYLPDAPLKK